MGASQRDVFQRRRNTAPTQSVSITLRVGIRETSGAREAKLVYTMNLVTRRILVGSVTAFCLLVACGGGVNPASKNGSGTTLGADGTCGPCAADSDCQSGCGVPAAGDNIWCCALNTSPTSCYGWEGESCPSPTSTSEDSGAAASTGAGTGSATSTGTSTNVGGAGCAGKACDAGGGVKKPPCRGRKCDAGGV
jgi:hypothetical protein